MPRQFTYPFCYTPDPQIIEASKLLVERIDASDFLRGIFAEGKMMGVLMVEDSAGAVSFLYAFSGAAGGRSVIDGFVPPIYDLLDPEGEFKRREAGISALNRQIDSAVAAGLDVAVLRRRRHAMSEELQRWIFEQYVVANALGERKTILEVFADQGLVPPGGTGDCAAPKLLQYAYLHSLKPLAMGEFWYGRSPAGEVRHQGCFYPSCTGKCGPLLKFMMQGLDVEPNPLDSDEAWMRDSTVRVLYEDDTVLVVVKPAGMLSVPGRNAGRVSLLERLGEGRAEVYSCHRLDMDTSGVMVFAKTLSAQACIQQQFEKRVVQKSYVARLVAPSDAAPLVAEHGFIRLPLLTDWYDRPRQMVDHQEGKMAVTEFQVIRQLLDGQIDIRLIPHTGRTHQLRVHCAHPMGLNRPIKGDRLYGGAVADAGGNVPERLFLHADSIAFRHPLTGETLRFEDGFLR